MDDNISSVVIAHSAYLLKDPHIVHHKGVLMIVLEHEE